MYRQNYPRPVPVTSSETTKSFIVSTLKFLIFLILLRRYSPIQEMNQVLCPFTFIKVIVQFKPLQCQDDCVNETTEQNVHHILDLGTNCQDDELTATPSTVEEIGTNVGIVFYYSDVIFSL